MTKIMNTVIQQHGDISSVPLEIFGEGEVILKIGDYLSMRGNPGSIEWICNHSRNTQLALLKGYVDIALTYEREQEEIAISEGWAENAGCIFHDHFTLVGPEHDPASVSEVKSIEEAFDRIASSQCLFYNRNDGSATMYKEREIWSRCHRHPWEANSNSSKWYIKTTYNPADAVSFATATGAYLLIDRSTLLKQVSRRTVANWAVFFEPTDPFHLLMNSCYALHTPLGSSSSNEEITKFIEYLKSDRGRKVIASYGVDKLGTPFFASVEQGFATTPLVGLHRNIYRAEQNI
ncbi:uncharacterized protein N7503_010318 [Penicillium pulvis]|uniref:uncharacterized protein n=1 Tax=Penicillium pulvis TaxID=1562058 RepID=UPI0025473B6E|nr:uncharacterized protein N7503_010318 [Penicillium pulvis]KAJ5785106.1 hypothetical protein N7503_010318 [Penicillium pulvis]